jgi:hypothetical protein
VPFKKLKLKLYLDNQICGHKSVHNILLPFNVHVFNGDDWCFTSGISNVSSLSFLLVSLPKGLASLSILFKEQYFVFSDFSHFPMIILFSFYLFISTVIFVFP